MGETTQECRLVVDAVSFDGLVQTDGAEVCDLNDLCNVHADVFEQHEEIKLGAMIYDPNSTEVT